MAILSSPFHKNIAASRARSADGVPHLVAPIRLALALTAFVAMAGDAWPGRANGATILILSGYTAACAAAWPASQWQLGWARGRLMHRLDAVACMAMTVVGGGADIFPLVCRLGSPYADQRLPLPASLSLAFTVPGTTAVASGRLSTPPTEIRYLQSLPWWGRGKLGGFNRFIVTPTWLEREAGRAGGVAASLYAGTPGSSSGPAGSPGPSCAAGVNLASGRANVCHSKILSRAHALRDHSPVDPLWPQSQHTIRPRTVHTRSP
jgi:hypothetical protein